MATTPKLGLYLPVGGDFSDVEVSMNPQLQLIDNAKDVDVVNGFGDLPVSPYTGKLGWVKLDNILYFWNGSAWVEILRRQNNWGKVAYVASDSAGSKVGANAESMYLKATYNQVVGRIYKISYSCNCDSDFIGGFGNNKINLRYRFGNDVATSDALLFWKWADMANDYTMASVSHGGTISYTADRTAQITIGMSLSRGSGSQNIFFAAGNHNNLMIEDIGWNG
jgi:hypothetical protein